MTTTTGSNARPVGDGSGRGSRQDDYITETAWLYFHDGMNQGDIAKRLNINRASVVNYLAEARRRDYVRITLDSDVFRNNQLAFDLKQRFGIADALVVPADTSCESLSFGRVIDQDGTPMPAPNDGQMIGVTLDQMREKDFGMLVSTGLNRVAAARAAMKGGYVTHLVTCSASAVQLLQGDT